MHLTRRTVHMDELSKLFDVLDAHGLLSTSILPEQNVTLMAMEVDNCNRMVDLLFNGGVWVDEGRIPGPRHMTIDTDTLTERLSAVGQ